MNIFLTYRFRWGAPITQVVQWEVVRLNFLSECLIITGTTLSCDSNSACFLLKILSFLRSRMSLIFSFVVLHLVLSVSIIIWFDKCSSCFQLKINTTSKSSNCACNRIDSLVTWKKILTVMILVWKNGLCANHQSFGEINFRLNLTYHYPGSDIFSQCQVVFILRYVQLIFNKYHVTIKGDSICHTKALFRWHMLINRIAFTPYLNKTNFNLPHKSDFATQKIMSW